MTLHDELVQSRETIARQADEIECLRQLVAEMARLHEYIESLPAATTRWPANGGSR